jgi:hypothetical protein
MTQAVASSPYALNEREPFRVRNINWLMGGTVACFAAWAIILISNALLSKESHILLVILDILLFAGFILSGLAVVTSQNVAAAFHYRQFEHWLNACPVSAENFTPEGLAKEAAFVDWILACPRRSFGFSFENTSGIVATKIVPSVELMLSEQGVTWLLGSPALRNILAAVLTLGNDSSKREVEDICRTILKRLADWVASDPKNWPWGRSIHTLLEDPVFAKISDAKELFPNFSGSIFPPKNSGEFSAVVSFLLSFSRNGGVSILTEDLAAKLFFSLISTAWCVPMDGETTVRFKRLFLSSEEYWDDEQHEKALEFCLCGHFGSEIAEFAVPYVADAWYPDVDSDFDPDEEERGSLGYRLVHSNLSAWVDSAAIPGVKLVLSDLGHPNVFQDDHPAGMPVEMRLEEDELPNSRY